jgi:hypothetical protein
MLFNRLPRIEHRSPNPSKGQEHLRPSWIAILRWLAAHKVEYVLVGPVAEAVRGDTHVDGPVAVVPAPYRRNLERLARALTKEHARLRVDAGAASGADAAPLKLDHEKLAQNTRWTLRCGAHDVDVEGGMGAGANNGTPSYQELLYEAVRFELEPELSVEVASPEYIEHFTQLRRTGSPPEIRIIRQNKDEQSGQARDSEVEQQNGHAQNSKVEQQNGHAQDSKVEQQRG